MRRIAVLLLASLPAWCAVTNVRVLGTTATQAIIGYTAPDASACTLEVSESASYAPLIHDVDTALFAGSNLDSRAGNLPAGRQRIFLVGKRTAEWAADGQRYSRALQADTDHYFRITCGGDQGTGSFRSSTIALGQTYTDPIAYDPDNLTFHGSGNVAYPTYPGLADNEAVIDPQTGALVRRIGKPAGEHRYDWVVMAVSAARDLNAAWTGEENVWDNDTDYAVYSAASQDPLALVLDSSKHPFYSLSYSLDYLTVSVIGWGAGAAEADRTIQVCLTLNAVACYGPWVDMALPAGDPGSTAETTATTRPYLWDWTPAGKQPPGPYDYPRKNAGTVSVSGTTVTASATGSFLPWWENGSLITIDGTERTIASITDDQNLELSAAPGDGSGLTWSAFNFGFLLRKKTLSADQITLDQVTVYGRTSAQSTWPTAGNEDVCAWVQSLKDGVPGYHCAHRNSGFFWVNAADGTSIMLGASVGTPAGASLTFFNGSGLDPATSGTIYALSNAAPTKVITKWQYTGTNQEVCATFNDGTDCGINKTITNLTPAPRDLYTLIAEFSALSPVGDIFDGTEYACDMGGLQPDPDYGSVIGLRCLLGGQDTLGWHVKFAPTKTAETPGCVGGGAPGCVIAAMSSTRGVPSLAQGNPLFHWGMLHYVSGMGDASGWTIAGTNWNEASTLKGGGHYLSLVSGSIAPEDTEITVTSEPYDPFPAAGETGAPGEYSTISPGDLLCITNTDHHTPASPACSWVAGLNTEESVRVTGKSGAAPNIVLTVERNKNLRPAGPGNWSGTIYAYAISNSAYPWTSGHYANKQFYWNYRADPHGINPTGAEQLIEHQNVGHQVYKQGFFIGAGVGVRQVTTLPDMVTASAVPWYSYIPTFAKAAVEGGYSGGYEAHPNWSQTDVAAASPERLSYVDLRPSMQSRLSLTVSVSNISGSLYSVTTASGKLNPKKTPILAFCGPQPLKDVSSAATGNILATDNSTPYQFCVPLNADECRTGSVPFDGVVNRVVYVNCPWVTDTSKIIVAGKAQSNEAMIQAGAGAKGAGHNNSLTRIITQAWGRHYLGDPYWSARSLPNGSWTVFRAPLVNGQRSDLMAVKLPAWREDSINRGTFGSLSITLGSVPSGTDNIVAEFGYDTSFYCTSRQEACWATGAAVNETTPFYWLSEAPAGLACAAGCTITIPAIPQRVVYYRLKYRNAGGAVIATGPTQAAIAP